MFSVIYEQLVEMSTSGKRFIAGIVTHIHMFIYKHSASWRGFR